MQALPHAEDANLGLFRAKRLVAGGFWQEPRFGEHCYRQNAQCAKKPLLCLREPQSAAAAETRRTKAHNTGILCAALKLIRDVTFPVTFLLNSQKPSCGGSFCTTWLCIFLVPWQPSNVNLRLSFQHTAVGSSTNGKRTVGTNFQCKHSFSLSERVEKFWRKMQALRHTEEANVELSGTKRRSRAAFGRSRALESTATGTSLSARRSRSFASGSRSARPLLRREERRRTTLAFSAQPSNSSGTVPFQSPTF
ncbi:unnamed protein product [Coccothraustes coccothraustes]